MKCLVMNLSEFLISNAPSTIYYIPNFITTIEEESILRHVYSVPKPKWTCLSNRRLQDYGGVPHSKGMIPEKIPAWLQMYIDKITKLEVFNKYEPNQVLVNEYLPGQGIMPHTDGPLFFPIITTISCGSHTVLEFLENNERRVKICDVLLEPRSLIVVKDHMYTKYLHSIKEVKEDIAGSCINLNKCGDKYSTDQQLQRETRVSLTIRYVPKVLKIKLF